ncbi:MAG: hypothetical protein M1820_010785 [Bogoriella megaspora]|nr:MAG: hypothetical protein M1820_010785 [Bogoriella megaspora]
MDSQRGLSPTAYNPEIRQVSRPPSAISSEGSIGRRSPLSPGLDTSINLPTSSSTHNVSPLEETPPQRPWDRPRQDTEKFKPGASTRQSTRADTSRNFSTLIECPNCHYRGDARRVESRENQGLNIELIQSRLLSCLNCFGHDEEHTELRCSNCNSAVTEHRETTAVRVTRAPSVDPTQDQNQEPRRISGPTSREQTQPSIESGQVNVVNAGVPKRNTQMLHDGQARIQDENVREAESTQNRSELADTDTRGRPDLPELDAGQVREVNAGHHQGLAELE